MSAITVPAAYKKLVIMLGHMFYSGQCPPAWWVDAAEPKKPENPAEAEMAMFEEKKASQLAREAKRKAQQDTSGLAIVLLTALAEKQWVEEDVLARDLNLPPKMVRKAMRYFEQEQLVQREHKKEGKRARKRERELMVQAGLRPAPGQEGTNVADAEEEDEGIVAGRIISYCALDYPRMLDSVRWRLAMMKKNWQKQMRGNNAVQKYKCPTVNCGRTFDSMDVFKLMPPPGSRSKQLTCDICGSEIDMVLDEDGTITGNMEDRKERQKRARAMHDAFDAAMAPLTAQLAACMGLTPPDFLSYNGWVHNEIAIRQRVQTIDTEATGAAARAQSKPESQQQQQRANQAASKPLPPWLMSAYKQQQQQHGHPPEQQQQDVSADMKADLAKAEQGLGVKPEPDSLAFKEEVKPEFKQEAEPGEADDWEAVPLGGGGSNGAAAAAAASDGDAAGDDAEDEDWEDV
ncbi:hypothetical protein OEZ86_000314 [Tetradesmus obliquus]|nr:hypothetical protein OEZ86_000314 [Tetradesmus obliquus]